MNYKFLTSNLLWILILLRNHFSWYQLIFLMATSDIYCSLKISVSVSFKDSHKECLLYFISSRNFRILFFVPFHSSMRQKQDFHMPVKLWDCQYNHWPVQHFQKKVPPLCGSSLGKQQRRNVVLSYRLGGNALRNIVKQLLRLLRKYSALGNSHIWLTFSFTAPYCL